MWTQQPAGSGRAQWPTAHRTSTTALHVRGEVQKGKRPGTAGWAGAAPVSGETVTGTLQLGAEVTLGGVWGDRASSKVTVMVQGTQEMLLRRACQPQTESGCEAQQGGRPLSSG